MKAATWAWTTEAMILLHYDKATSLSCLTSLRVVSEKVVHFLTICTHLHLPTRRQRAPQQPCLYAMLVESDIQRRARSILP